VVGAAVACVVGAADGVGDEAIGDRVGDAGNGVAAIGAGVAAGEGKAAIAVAAGCTVVRRPPKK